MIVSFELSMPGRNSWNGKWSGEANYYAIFKSFRVTPKKPLPFKLGSYGYNFGDGWHANVAVREVTSSAARSLRKQSRGFCGYDWMVESIIRDGDIYGPTQPNPKVSK